MNKVTALTAAAVLAITVSPVLAACSTKTEKPAAETSQSTDHKGPEHGGSTTPAASGTLHDYVMANKIAETPFKPNEPGTPKFDFPFPPDWGPAGDLTPDWAYGAIIYDKPVDPQDPPFLYAIASKLTGNIDAEKVLQLAPAQLDDLPEFKAEGKPERGKFSGYDAVTYVGTYTWEGKARAVGQQTIAVPGKDGVFVLQLNGEAPQGQEQVVIDAADLIAEKTTITLPS